MIFKILNEELIVYKDKLNPVLWDENDSLKPEVREKILELVNEFNNNLETPLAILDVELVGSNASYNYNDKSDVDVHIITNFSNYGDPEELVSAAVNAFKTNFNKAYNVDYDGYNVEIYVEDVNSSPMSNGIYSVLRDEWIKKPEPIDPIDVELEPELTDYRKRINTILQGDSVEDIQNMIDALYVLRRNSLATGGEFSKGNLIFKAIRNDGLLDGLKNKKVELRSKELSI